MDGGEDLLSHIALSGEAQIPQCTVEPGKHFNAREVAALNVQKREYQEEIYGLLEQHRQFDYDWKAS